MSLVLLISSIEVEATSKRLLVHHNDNDNVKEHSCKRIKCVTGAADQVSSVLESVLPLIVEDVLYERLATRS